MQPGEFDLKQFLISLLVIVLSVGLHEFGHAFTADRLGDPGPRRAGRISLWPDRHWDLTGFLMMMVVLASGWGLGWGKPVMVDKRYFKNPRAGMLITAAAGPLMNLLIALIAGLILRFSAFVIHNGAQISLLGLNSQENVSTTVEIILSFLLINISLMFFNLLPIHPLDGSKVLSALLPARQAEWYDATVGSYGPILLIALVILGRANPSLNILGFLLGPAVSYTASLILGVSV